MTWEADSLEYGYVLARPAEGGWWHLHFGRGDMTYRCELLGRSTDILACVQLFSAGGSARSPQFVFTLDGERVDLPADRPALDFDWKDTQHSHEAAHFQREVMPLLYESSSFQSAMAEVVRSQR